MAYHKGNNISCFLKKSRENCEDVKAHTVRFTSELCFLWPAYVTVFDVICIAEIQNFIIVKLTIVVPTL